MVKKIAILGAGAFGFAVAKMIGEQEFKDKEIYLYDVNSKGINHIKKTREHPIFYKNVKLPENVKATTSIKTAVQNTDLLILAIPTKFLRVAIKEFGQYVKDCATILNLGKGLEKESNLRVSEVIKSEIKKKNYCYCVLSGGMIAKELVAQKPLCADLACECRDDAKMIAKIFYTDYFRIETTNDLIGTELAGAFKNVVAIGAGIFDGMGNEQSSKSGYISLVSSEVKKLAIAMGAQEKTFETGSQSWFGDLMTTCFGASRNREFGELIGKGVKSKEALNIMIENHKSVEGYITTKVVYELVKEHKIDAPILENLYKILYKRESPEKFIKNFITH